MKNMIFALALVAALSGCDAASNIGAALAKTLPAQPPMTLVILPGYEMIVDGKSAPIYGKDECPKRDGGFLNALFGREPDELESHGCVVITPDTKTINVTIGLPTGPSEETWSVERDADRTMLRRENGDLLAGAK